MCSFLRVAFGTCTHHQQLENGRDSMPISVLLSVDIISLVVVTNVLFFLLLLVNLLYPLLRHLSRSFRRGQSVICIFGELVGYHIHVLGEAPLQK
jgi:hypothetical protein